MNDEAEVLLPVGLPLTDRAKTALCVIAKTRSPAAITDASIGNNFCSHVLLLKSSL